MEHYRGNAPRSQHIALVALLVRDYDEALEFYIDRLGAQTGGRVFLF